MQGTVTLGEIDMNNFFIKITSSVYAYVSVTLLVCIIRSMMDNVIYPISMKNAIMMVMTVVQMLPKLVIASATLKMTSELVIMMVEIAV